MDRDALLKSKDTILALVSLSIISKDTLAVGLIEWDLRTSCGFIAVPNTVKTVFLAKPWF